MDTFHTEGADASWVQLDLGPFTQCPHGRVLRETRQPFAPPSATTNRRQGPSERVCQTRGGTPCTGLGKSQQWKYTALREKRAVTLPIWAGFRYLCRQNCMLFRICCLRRIGHKGQSLLSFWLRQLPPGRTSSVDVEDEQMTHWDGP